MGSRALLIFARSPEAEAVAKRLPVATAAPVFRAVVHSWIASADAAGATPIIACRAEDLPRLSADATFIEQRGTSFGERLANAAQDARKLGFEAVILTGIDAPPQDLELAFRQLESGRAVIAPACGGGLNLIGGSSPEFLATIRLREKHLARRYRLAFPDLFVLANSSDIDSMADVAAARSERAWFEHLFLLDSCLTQGWNARYFHQRDVARPILCDVNRAPPVAP